MNLTRKKLPLILIFIGIIGGYMSCIKETYDMEKLSLKADLRPGIAAPAAHGVITLGDLIETNDTLKVDTDSTFMMSIDMDTLFSIDVSEVIEIDASDIGGGISNSYDLGAVTLNDVNFEKVITLSTLANNLDPATKTALEAADGLSVFPNVPAQDGGEYPASQDDTYEYVTFSKGKIVMKIRNNFSTEITNITIVVNDSSATNNTGFYTHTFIFNDVPVDTEVSDSTSLVGETLYNPVNFCIKNIQINQNLSTPRPINYNSDSVAFIAQMKELEIIGGSAKFERPEPLDSLANQVIDIADKPEIELERLTLLSGAVNYDINNGIGEQITINVKFPYTTSGGDTVSENIVIPPNTTRNGIIDLAGSVTDLTLGNTTNNTFSVRYSVNVDSSGLYIPFDSSNAVSYDFSFDNVEFDVIEGYFGKDTISEDSVFDFDMGGNEMFDKFEGGFNLSNPQLILKYDNSLGVPISFDLGLSTETNEGTVTAGGEKTMGVPTIIGNTESGELLFNKDDDLDKLFSFPLPDEIAYDVEALVNADGKTGTSNFITHDGKLSLGMEMKIPFALKSDGFGYPDTISFEMPDGISAEYANLTFIITNDIPFNVRIKAFPWDSVGNQVFDKVIDTLLLKASEVDDNGDFVASTKFETSVVIDSEEFDNISVSDHIIINATIDTKDNQGVAKDAKIKSDQKIDFKVIVKAQAKIERLDGFGGDGDNND